MSELEKDYFRVVLSVGSNLGDRLENLKYAVRKLQSENHLTVLVSGGVYENSPVGDGFSSDFLNSVIVLDTELSPLEILNLIHHIEQSAGRNREKEDTTGIRDRVLDIDIIFYGDLVLSDESLTIPHEEWKNRDFVVLPLIDAKQFLTDFQAQNLEQISHEVKVRPGTCRRTDYVLM